jgi:phosphatidylglycerophosphatase A
VNLPRPANAAEALALFLGTGAFTGLAPVASGTFGTLPAVALVWALPPMGTAAWLVMLAVVVVVAVWASERCRVLLDEEDPGRVVIDEVAGFLVTMTLVPLSPVTLVAGFLAFRLFDVVKPPPARQLEHMYGGVGIVADDLMAGVYANLLLQALIFVEILP